MQKQDIKVQKQISISRRRTFNVTEMECLSEAQRCEAAVAAIWRNLDKKVLGEKVARDALAAVLDQVPKLVLPDRLPRLITTLQLPDPIDASTLYWLTRRLLTVVPELQTAILMMSKPVSKPPGT